MSSFDPYKVLGVTSDASQEQIRKSYRRLAKKLHPDLNPGNARAEQEFKDVAMAYDLLGDPEKRARFDRGEIDETGVEQTRRYYRDFASARGEESRGNYTSDAGFADFTNASDLFSELFRRGRPGRSTRGEDVRYRLPIDFLEAVNGASRRVKLPDASELDLKIPAGIRDRQIIRLPGKGKPGPAGGPTGDALFEVEVQPHPYFERRGDDIHVELPVSLAEAVLGKQIEAPTPQGPVSVRIPRGSNSGRVLRLRGKGVGRRDGSRGDEYARLKVMLPEIPDPGLEEFVSNWRAGKSHNPRRKMGL